MSIPAYKEVSLPINVLAELGRLPIKIYKETQMIQYLQRFPFLEENTYLRKVINEETKIKFWGG